MQTTSPQFTQLAQGYVRPLSWQFRASFDKTFDDAVDFFILDSSILDGNDVLAPSDSDVIQEWDKYDYADYSGRVIQMEWEREEQVPYSINLAMSDIILNNYDNLFTRGAGSVLDANLLPRRPIRILAGFNGENLPQFVGLTDTVPIIDYSSKTASIHSQDFLSYLFSKPLDEAVMLENVTTDEVLDYLFQLFGLLPAQYVLDEGFNNMQFVYWEKGKILGEAVKELMQAELGSLYMDELGLIRFRNRVKSSSSSIYTFTKDRIRDYRTSTETNIVNVVKIRASVRQVQIGEIIYNLGEPIEILPNSVFEDFYDYEDPVTAVNTPVYTANSMADGSGSDQTASVVVDSQTNFSTSSKIGFENTSGSTVYITSMTITGNPARVINKVYLPLIDQDSIDQFEEQIMEIDNSYVQTQDAANSLGLSIINYYKDYANTIEISVKGNFALQLGDNIDVQIDNIDETYTITKITNILSSGEFTQRLTGKVFNIPNFFILSSDAVAMSLLDGNDVLAP